MKKLLVGLAATTALVALAPNANATLTFWASIGGTIVSCADQAACDTNPAVGQLAIADQTVNNVQILGNSVTQTVGPPQNSLNAASFQLINNNAAGTVIPITVEVSGTTFTQPITSFAASGAGTFQNATGSNITLTYFIDPTNAQGAPGTPGTQVATFTHAAGDPTINPDSFSFNSGNQPFSALTAFSMTLDAVGQLVGGGGELVGRTQAIINQVATVPEPGTLGLLGSMLGFAGFMWWRRRRTDDPTGFSAA